MATVGVKGLMNVWYDRHIRSWWHCLMLCYCVRSQIIMIVLLWLF